MYCIGKSLTHLLLPRATNKGVRNYFHLEM